MHVIKEQVGGVLLKEVDYRQWELEHPGSEAVLFCMSIHSAVFFLEHE